MSKTYLDDIDTDQVSSLLKSTDNNSEYFTSVTNEVINSYSQDLDHIMNSIRNIIQNSSNIEIDVIEQYILLLSNTLYFIGEKLEVVGIKSDVSKAARQEIYNRAYLENDIEKFDENGKRSKPTKDANIAVAEEKSKYESVVNNIYERTYKVIKFKIDAGYEMLSSLKKIINRRMQEIDLSMYKQPKSNFNMKEQ
jgi:hypothetical protein